MARKQTQAKSPFTGRWRIVSMSGWDEDYIDAEEEGYIEFAEQVLSEFHLGYVYGEMDCYLTTRDGKPAVEWTWVGNDEMDEVQGRGWAVLQGEELQGMIFFHAGDNSEFIAKRAKAKQPKQKR